MKLLVALLAIQSTCRGEILPAGLLTTVRDGITEVYNLNHDQAVARFESLIREAPNDPTGYAYLAWAIWLKELAKRQELSIDRFADTDFFTEKQNPLPPAAPGLESRVRELNATAQRLALARRRQNPRDLAALFVLGFSYQTNASLEVSLHRSWYSAFREGSKTFRYHRQLLEIDPNAHDARLANGVYLYVAGSLDWVEKAVAWFIGYYGDRERGKRELETAAAKGLLAADDARVILALIYTRERNFDKAFEQMQTLARRYPRNYLLALEQAGIEIRRGHYPQAIAAYRALLDSEPRLEKALLYNRLGVAYRESGDLPQAAGWFARVLADRNASERAGTIARLELGRCLQRMNRREDAGTYWREVLLRPDVAGSREEARKLLSSR